MSTRSPPAPALTSAISTAVSSASAGAVSREIRARLPRACSVNSSASEVPRTRRVSRPSWPSIRSKASAAVWIALSSPAPSRTASSPPPGLTRSASSPLSMTSAWLEPLTTSAPGPVSIRSPSTAVESSIRTSSAPAPERISTLLKRARLTANGWPPAATSTLARVPVSVILSAASSPVIVSVPPVTPTVVAASAEVESATAAVSAMKRVRRSIAASWPPRRSAGIRGFP